MTSIICTIKSGEVWGPFWKKVTLQVEPHPVPVEGTLLAHKDTFSPERSRHLSNFNGANDRSHRQLFESAIRFANIYFCKSYMDISSDLVSLVGMGPYPNIHVTFAKMILYQI